MNEDLEYALNIAAHAYANGMTPQCSNREALKRTYYANYIAGAKWMLEKIRQTSIITIEE